MKSKLCCTLLFEEVCVLSYFAHMQTEIQQAMSAKKEVKLTLQMLSVYVIICDKTFW